MANLTQSTTKPCPDLGCLCSKGCPSGILEGKCNTDNTCDYSGGILVAGCIPFDQQTRDSSQDSELIPCDTNLDCPESLDFCHSNQNAQENGHGGFCAPLSCIPPTLSECPFIGDECNGINGTCNDGRCTYNQRLGPLSE